MTRRDAAVLAAAMAMLVAAAGRPAQAQTPSGPGAVPSEAWLAERQARLAGLKARQVRERQAETDAANVVVTLTASLPGESVFGAGIVLGRRDGTVYIATANHVVRRGADVATDLQIRFRQRQGSPQAGVVTPQFDADLDMALLTVDDRDGGVDTCGPDFRVLGLRGKDRFGPGASAMPVGNPNGRGWLRVLGSEAVIEDITPDRLRYQSMMQSPGHSGGALIAGRAQLVGMVIEDAPPYGHAVPVDRLLRQAWAWGAPVQLRARWRLVTEGVPAFPEGGNHEHALAALMRRAVEANDLATVRRIVAEHCEPALLMELPGGPSPLHLAVRGGLVDMARLLLAGGAWVDNTGWPRDETPLHLAAAANQTDIARALLAAGAKADLKNSRGQTALDLAPAGSPVAELLRSRAGQ